MSRPGETTLLAIDDEPGNLEVYERFLRRRPGGRDDAEDAPRSSRREHAAPTPAPRATIRLLLARSGEEAVELVARELSAGRVVDGAFCDMRMPGGMDGLETIARLRSLDPDMAFTLVTGDDAYTPDRISGRLDPACPWVYCVKPFKHDEIQRHATWMTARRRARPARPSTTIDPPIERTARGAR